jgi:hypothetical protein
MHVRDKLTRGKGLRALFLITAGEIRGTLWTNYTYCQAMGRLGEERWNNHHHLLLFRNSHSGMAFGIDQSPRFSAPPTTTTLLGLPSLTDSGRRLPRPTDALSPCLIDGAKYPIVAQRQRSGAKISRYFPASSAVQINPAAGGTSAPSRRKNSYFVRRS